MATYDAECLNCKKQFEARSEYAKTCSEKCRKQLSRRREHLNDGYSLIMSELSKIKDLLRTHKHPSTKKRIAEAMEAISAEAQSIGRMSGNRDMIDLHEMKTQIANKKS